MRGYAKARLATAGALITAAVTVAAALRYGDVAAALQVYTDARAALVEELGVEPGPALRAAQHEILRAEPEEEKRQEPKPAQLPGDLSAFTGRAGNLRQLDEAFAASRQGIAQLASNPQVWDQEVEAYRTVYLSSIQPEQASTATSGRMPAATE